MKYGIRKPSVKKSLKARTTGKVKRQLKKSVNPLYGKTGMGLINDPKKAVYNKVYSKTTVGVGDAARIVSGGSSAASHTEHTAPQQVVVENLDPKMLKRIKTNRVLFFLLAAVFVFLGLVTLPVGIIFIVLAVLFFILGRKANGIVKSQMQ